MALLGVVTVTDSDYLIGPLGKVIVCNHLRWVDPLWVIPDLNRVLLKMLYVITLH